jgi:hypothetical protein
MSILDYGLQGLDWYQQNQSFDDSREDINKGFDNARSDIKEYQQPYQDFGLEHMQGYNDLGEFNFQYGGDNFQNDPSYQFRRDESMKQAQRSAAGRGMLNSTNTLNSLTERAGDLASQEYQASFDRSKGTYDTNRAYHQYGVGTGASAAENMGNNLSDIAGARGMSNAAIEQAKAASMSGLIGGVRDSMGYGGAGAAGAAGGALGGAVDQGLEWLGDKAGDAAGAVGGMLGLGGAAVAGDTMLGTAAGNTAMQWGTGGLDAALGGAGGAGATGGAAGAGGTRFLAPGFWRDD